MASDRVIVALIHSGKDVPLRFGEVVYLPHILRLEVRKPKLDEEH